MSRVPRGLSPEESALWNRLAESVRPINPPNPGKGTPTAQGSFAPPLGEGLGVGVRLPSSKPNTPSRPPPPGGGESGLDSHWERRLSRSSTAPDFTLDLHGCTLDQAHRRLDAGLTQARAMDARLVLVITGKQRAVEAADRGNARGAIRAKIVDWLAAGQHASTITAIRPAPRRHGGEGALYLVLRKS